MRTTSAERRRTSAAQPATRHETALFAAKAANRASLAVVESIGAATASEASANVRGHLQACIGHCLLALNAGGAFDLRRAIALAEGEGREEEPECCSKCGT